ncbi:hypothetical protein N7490_002160 [Penicillium lividum]|nr:hypothetical protein N7490_002160 [Penicillium lividum]
MSIKVAHCNTLRDPYIKCGLRLEATIPISKQDAHYSVDVIRSHDIEMVISSKIANCNGTWRGSHLTCGLRLEAHAFHSAGT